MCKYICVHFHEGTPGDGGRRTALPYVFFLESKEVESYSNIGMLDLEDALKIRKSATHSINVSIFFFFFSGVREKSCQACPYSTVWEENA